MVHHNESGISRSLTIDGIGVRDAHFCGRTGGIRLHGFHDCGVEAGCIGGMIGDILSVLLVGIYAK